MLEPLLLYHQLLPILGGSLVRNIVVSSRANSQTFAQGAEEQPGVASLVLSNDGMPPINYLPNDSFPNPSKIPC